MQRRKKSAGARRMKNAGAARDATLRAFKAQDLGDDITSARRAVVVRPQRPMSILLSDELKVLAPRSRELEGTPVDVRHEREPEAGVAGGRLDVF